MEIQWKLQQSSFPKAQSIYRLHSEKGPRNTQIFNNKTNKHTRICITSKYKTFYAGVFLCMIAKLFSHSLWNKVTIISKLNSSEIQSKPQAMQLVINGGRILWFMQVVMWYYVIKTRIIWWTELGLGTEKRSVLKRLIVKHWEVFTQTPKALLEINVITEPKRELCRFIISVTLPASNL
jgi:hypothetical protein